MLFGFLLVFAGVMAANLLSRMLTPDLRLLYPAWVLVCLVPAYWYGHRIGFVSLALGEILGVVGVVVVAVAVFEVWAIVRPFSAVTLAALVCLFLLARRRWLGRTGAKR